MTRYAIITALVLLQLHAVLFPAAASEPGLWPISVEGKWGYIDVNGKVKIEPQYAAANSFSDGLALVSVFGTTEADLAFKRTYDGFIDPTGRCTIPTEFPTFYKNREDYDSYAYSSFSNGVAIVRDASRSNGVRGLIDRTGKLIAPMKFSSIDSFGEGLCVAEQQPTEEGNLPPIEGYMNFQGEFIVRPQGFLYGGAFQDGRANITVRDDYGDHKLMIDRQGTVIVPPGIYSSIYGLECGLSRVVKDGEVGLIDRDGKVVVPLGKYEQISNPESGAMYLGEKNGAYFAIGSDGKATKLPDFGAEPIRYRGDVIWIKSNEKYGYAKLDGTIVIEPAFDGLQKFDGELAMFHKSSEVGFINRSGKVVWSTKNWELPLQYSVREPLKNYLPDFGLEAMSLSYNWDCDNVIVFVCDGTIESLRKWYLSKQSEDVKVRDYTDYEFEPGKLDMRILADDIGFTEIYAMPGNKESSDSKPTDDFVSFYHCKNMNELRKKHPNKTIGIVLEN